MENTGVGYEPKLHSVEYTDLPCMDVHWQNEVYFSVHFPMILNIIWLLLSIELTVP